MTNPLERVTLKTCILSMIILVTCILTVFPGAYLACNIILVVLSVCLYFSGTHGKLMFSDLLVLGFAFMEIVVTMDVSRIAIFVFYLFIRNVRAYNRSSIKLCVAMMSFFFVLVLIAYTMGFNADYDKYSWDSSIQGMIEEKALGFTNANRCMLFAYVISCMMLLLTDKTLHYLLILAANYLLFQQTQGRTFFYLILALVAVLILFKVIRREKSVSFIGRHMHYAFPAMFLLSVGLSLFFANTWLNDLFRGRLNLNANFLDRGLSLWGYEGSIDNAYVYMLIAKGVVYTLVFAVMLFFTFRKSKLNNKNAMILLSIFCVGIMEVIFFETPVMLLLGAIFGFNKEMSAHES